MYVSYYFVNRESPQICTTILSSVSSHLHICPLNETIPLSLLYNARMFVK